MYEHVMFALIIVYYYDFFNDHSLELNLNFAVAKIFHGGVRRTQVTTGSDPSHCR